MDSTHARPEPAKQTKALKTNGTTGAVAFVLAAMLLHQLFIFICTTGTNYTLLNPADYVRYDSYLYLDIAGKWYELFPCWERFEAYPKGSPDWCGNAGWMPLYPALIRVLVFAGLSDYFSAWLLSRLFYLAALIFIYLLVKNEGKTRIALTLALAALFPASIYYDAAFPLSLMLALYTGSFYFWTQGHLRKACILAFFIPSAYSTGFVGMAPWGLLGAILLYKGLPGYRSAFAMAASIAAGYAAFFIVQKFSLGVWNGFFLVQAKYGHGLHNMLPPVKNMLKSIWLSGMNHNWQPIQSLMFIALMLPVLRLQESDAGTLFLKLSFICYLLFPLLVGSDQLSLFRSEALLFPVVILLARKPGLALLLIPVFVYLLCGCVLDFFDWKIV